MRRAIQVPKSRMNVRTEHKLKLAGASKDSLITLERHYPKNSNDSQVAKELTVANMKYLVKKETSKEQVFVIKKKRVMVKEIDLDKDYIYGFSASKHKTIITQIKDLLVSKKIKPTKENIAKAYNNVIIKMRKEGIPLPKMKAIVLDDKLLLISQYFGKRNPNRLVSKLEKVLEYSFPENAKKSELLDLYAKTINAGFFPSFDFIEVLEKKDGSTEYLPFDIDQQVLDYLKYGDIRQVDDKQKPEVIREIKAGISYVIFRTTSEEEVKRKFNYLRKRITIDWVAKKLNYNPKTYYD